MELKQLELVAAANNGDYIKAAILSEELVLLKARVQALHAVDHELSSLIKRSRLVMPEQSSRAEGLVKAERIASSVDIGSVAKEESADMATAVSSETTMAKVIPLRRR